MISFQTVFLERRVWYYSIIKLQKYYQKFSMSSPNSHGKFSFESLLSHFVLTIISNMSFLPALQWYNKENMHDANILKMYANYWRKSHFRPLNTKRNYSVPIIWKCYHNIVRTKLMSFKQFVCKNKLITVPISKYPKNMKFPILGLKSL